MTKEREEVEKLLHEVYTELERENELDQIKKLLDDSGIPIKSAGLVERLRPVMMLWNSVDSSLRQRCLMAFS